MQLSNAERFPPARALGIKVPARSSNLQIHSLPRHYQTQLARKKKFGLVTGKLSFVFLLICFFLISAGVSAQTQTTEEVKELKREVEALKATQADLRKELQELKKLMLARSAPNLNRELIISTSGAAIKGDQNARVTLIELSDYQCPYCSRYFQQTLPQLERDYIKTGKLKYVFIDFPIETLHPSALTASIAARCAGEQGKYWEMHDRLFANHQDLAAANMILHAQAIQMDVPKFSQCLDSKKYESEIRDKVAEMKQAGVNGTPTFFLGLTSPNDPKVKIVSALNGAKSYDSFKALIDNLLSTQTSQGQ